MEYKNPPKPKPVLSIYTLLTVGHTYLAVESWHNNHTPQYIPVSVLLYTSIILTDPTFRLVKQSLHMYMYIA